MQETWTEMQIRDMFDNYDGILISGMRIGTNQLPAEDHSFIRFDISGNTDLLKQIEEKVVKPVNDYFLEKNGSKYINSRMKLNKYKGYTDVTTVLENIFCKALEEFEMFADQDNLWEKEVKEQMGYVDQELD